MKKNAYICLFILQCQNFFGSDIPICSQENIRAINKVNATVNRILGKVCSIQTQGALIISETDIIVMSVSDEIISELNSCCERLSSQIDTIQEGNIDSCCEALSAQIDSCCDFLSSEIDVTAASIDSCCDFLSSEIDVTAASIDSCCDFLSSQIEETESTIIDTIDSCCDALTEQIACFAQELPTTQAAITESGSYHLCADRGPLTISAGGVVLEMNGHLISSTVGDALTITGSAVTVRNGRIFTTAAGANSILLSGNSYKIENMEIIRADDPGTDERGINITITATGGTIERVRTRGFNSVGSIGFLVNGPNAILRLCSDTSSRTSYRVTNFAFGAIIEECTSFSAIGNGFLLQSFTGGLTNVGVLIKDCVVRGSGDGFQFSNNVSSWLCLNCISTANSGAGFTISATTNINGIIKNCLSDFNGSDGFAQGSGIPDTQIISCIADANSNVGFNTVATFPRLFNNYGTANTVANYSVAAFASNQIQNDVVLNSDVGWWANVGL